MEEKYYFANILSVNRLVDFLYEKLRKYHPDDISEAIIGEVIVPEKKKFCV